MGNVFDECQDNDAIAVGSEMVVGDDWEAEVTLGGRALSTKLPPEGEGVDASSGRCMVTLIAPTVDTDIDSDLEAVIDADAAFVAPDWV